MSGNISPWPVVQSGSNGHPIKTLQYLLRARGHSVAVDGVFGPQYRSRGESVSGKPWVDGRRDRRSRDVGGSCRPGQKGKPRRRG